MSGHIAVVEKTFLVLEAMSELGRSATLQELTETTGLPKATLYRILQTLAKLGYVDQDQARSRYGLTLRMYELGRGDGYEDLRQQALPVMELLHQRFNETVNLGILQGTHIIYVHYIETTRSVRWQVRPGVRDPFHCTALGRAIAAFLPETRQRKLLDAMTLVQRTPLSPVDRATVEAVLEETAERGWAQDDEENDAGVVCFGVPLIDDGMPVAGISISVVKSRLTPELREEIISAMEEIGPQVTQRPRLVATRKAQ
ncbi:MAG: IclR family transcriptional regulator [Roseitalea sp.]|nr:IclR family transcriptional regulator [Roseitalea sp.]MBO6743619.1 IclR family transcriptional regulator [Roseitalea sp.]